MACKLHYLAVLINFHRSEMFENIHGFLFLDNRPEESNGYLKNVRWAIGVYGA